MQKNFCEQKNILPRREPEQDIFELSYFTSSMTAVSAASPRRTPVRMMRV